jgi:hypothetical protein
MDIVVVHVAKKKISPSHKTQKSRSPRSSIDVSLSNTVEACILNNMGLFEEAPTYRLLECICRRPAVEDPEKLTEFITQASAEFLVLFNLPAYSVQYRPMVFIGVREGALVVRKALFDSEPLRSRTTGTAFLSAPNDLPMLKEWSVKSHIKRAVMQLDETGILPLPSDPRWLKLRAFLRYNFNISSVDILIQAIINNDYTLLRVPAKYGIDLSKEAKSPSALFEAAKLGRQDYVRMLLESRVDPNSPVPGQEWTPLMIAANQGNSGVVQLLLRNGADMTIKTTTDRKTALDVAADHVKKLLETRQAVEGPSLKPKATVRRRREPVKLNDPDVSSEFYGKIVDFYHILVDGEPTEQHVPENKTVYDIVYGLGPRQLMADVSIKKKDLGTYQFRWIHLPANNLQWMENLVDKVLTGEIPLEDDGSQYVSSRTSDIMDESNWIGQQDVSPVRTLEHLRFLKPQARTLNQDGKRKDYETDRRELDTFLFMPYLHYETNRNRETMADLIQKAGAKARKTKERRMSMVTKLTDPSFTILGRDGKLISAHLHDTLPVHCRRTLDQYYYSTIHTDFRDKDQVVMRYMVDEWPSSDPNVIMVDQLWMVILADRTPVKVFRSVQHSNSQ